MRIPSGIGLEVRHADDERDPGRLFEATLLEPQAVLAQVIAVVAPEHDDRVVAQPQPVHGVEDAPNLRIHK
jgi:hypothetical protein